MQDLIYIFNYLGIKYEVVPNNSRYSYLYIDLGNKKDNDEHPAFFDPMWSNLIGESCLLRMYLILSKTFYEYYGT